MEEILKQLLEGQKQLSNKIEKMDNRLERIDNRLTRVEQQMVTKEDMDENTRILRALEHASQVNAAEMEGLKLNSATKDSIERLEAKFEVLNKRLFEQEAELHLIKKAQ